MRKVYFVGLNEEVEILGKKYLAKIDTGACRNSIDRNLARKLGLCKVVNRKSVRSSNGSSYRDIVECFVKVGGRKMHTTFSLADRKDMKYSIILGRNFLKRGFLVDPCGIFSNENSNN